MLDKNKAKNERGTFDITEHPEYPTENDRLNNTISAIRKFISRTLATEAVGGDSWATENLRNHLASKAADYNGVVESPYFGRIDFTISQSETDEYYIGYRGLQLGKVEVIDWRAPVGKLFYGSTAEKQSYNSPNGVIKGRLLLKRRFKIAAQKLLDIADEIDRRPERPTDAKMVSADAYLLQALYSRGDPQLQDIVKTIQEQQDRIIRARSDLTLIINGVAGSGKTSIAYHRLAYLLYPETTSGKLKHQNTIVFAPNRIFLSYVADLLPRLGVKDVLQVAFDDWALEFMRLAKFNNGIYQRKFKLQEVSIRTFLDIKSKSSEKADHWRRARIKGSVKIQEILSNYLRLNLDAITLPQDGLMFNDLGDIHLSLGLSIDELREALIETLGLELPFHKKRERFITRINEALSNKYERSVTMEYYNLLNIANRIDVQIDNVNDQSSPEKIRELKKKAEQFRNRAFATPFIRQQVLNQAKSQFDNEVQQIWPRIDLYQGYYHLLSNRELVQKCANELLSDEEINLLSSYIPPADIIDLEDIPALICLFLLLEGHGERQYDHIVIDEAQDFSPLQFLLFRKLFPDATMTIVGDIAQGIYAHRGVSRWDEISALFEPETLKVEHITQNYRSTQEIVEFNNLVMKNIHRKDITPAIPFHRHGIKPKIVITSDSQKMFMSIAMDINSLLSQQLNHIGIIVKSNVDCASVDSNLRIAGIEAINVISDRDGALKYSGGVVILPVNLAKGIEFQAAFIVEVSAKKYSAEIEYDARLLYVAVTRALQILNLYTYSSLSPLVESAKALAEVVHI